MTMEDLVRRGSVQRVPRPSVPGVDAVTKLDRLRRTRNRAEYAGHWFDPKEVVSGLETARAIVLWAQQALDASTRSKQ